MPTPISGERKKLVLVARTTDAYTLRAEAVTASYIYFVLRELVNVNQTATMKTFATSWLSPATAKLACYLEENIKYY